MKYATLSAGHGRNATTPTSVRTLFPSRLCLDHASCRRRVRNRRFQRGSKPYRPRSFTPFPLPPLSLPLPALRRIWLRTKITRNEVCTRWFRGERPIFRYFSADRRLFVSPVLSSESILSNESFLCGEEGLPLCLLITGAQVWELTVGFAEWMRSCFDSRSRFFLSCFFFFFFFRQKRGSLEQCVVITGCCRYSRWLLQIFSNSVKHNYSTFVIYLVRYQFCLINFILVWSNLE